MGDTESKTTQEAVAADNTEAKRMQYCGKMMLAPMVRMGTLPTRLLALRYGADLVYGEEIVDYKILRCSRVENPVLDTVDFVMPSGLVVFRTCKEEKDRVIFQMGTADPQRAVEVAKLVENDVAGIDVNMGCPKNFSIKGGMGAALLREPDLAYDIMAALTKAVKVPVTCKIRLLPTREATMSFMKRMQSTGIAAIGLHGRLREQRPREPVQLDAMTAAIGDMHIPVIANGGSLDFKNYSEAHAWMEKTGCDSLMIARAAQNNLSVFRKEGTLPQVDVAREYMLLALQYDNAVGNTKYCLQKLLSKCLTSDLGKQVHGAHTMRQLCAAFGLTSEYETTTRQQEEAAQRFGFTLTPSDDQIDEAKGTPIEALLKEEMDKDGKSDGDGDGECGDEGARKRPKIDPHDVTIIDNAKYFRRHFKRCKTPREHLSNYTTRYNLPAAEFETHQTKDRRFVCTCRVGDSVYAPRDPSSSKKEALQSAALAALIARGVVSFSCDFEARESTLRVLDSNLEPKTTQQSATA
ncbi:tRNA-dihydrouridine synthase [Salpingoeca rosetta]|uniref:tRNA-dihydrouridine synthase n=1 Tax=Salpingoeca rosetta (strain ATCC 50818 / BSB-021) TaxID=946362 RepID=F2UB60_SALR5|nr:tRNA-dihydrouridine synthase [Salpingoeca rosetta]EGD74073.1 tRNA-dihydrouridine synthase [Salpingoeca rosetta]|eukprot:XP_004993635.1 tRNA-dihydrouridine synthase [Salpingoeca rosetta]